MNRMVVFEDMPSEYDAWNINAYYEEKSWTVDELSSVCVVEDGPVRAVLRITRPFMNSTISQDITLYSEIDRIDVKNNVDWKDSNLLLKADFPFNVNSTKATFDIQFGNLERSTTKNTSWDFSQFEVCAHRWADLSEEGYGLAILNDCKYGYDVKNGHIRLTMLKAPVYPYRDADKEIHTFTYSIYPHANGWRSAGVADQAESLNCPLYARITNNQNGKLDNSYSLVKINVPNVKIGAVKRSEDEKYLVLRLNEFFNKTTKATLTFDSDIELACESNLLEEGEEPLTFAENTLVLELRPYDIRTLKIKLK